MGDAVIFEYKNVPGAADAVTKNDGAVKDNELDNNNDVDDDDNVSLVWECGNVCNAYLCETEVCRRALRTTLLQRVEELDLRLSELDVRQDKKVGQRPTPVASYFFYFGHFKQQWVEPFIWQQWVKANIWQLWPPV